jgi:hypothetical protein
MKTKLITGAQIAKDQGYKYIVSVVKNYRATTYYHYVSINEVLAVGRWIPATKVAMMPWHGRIGVTARNLPDNCILRQRVYDLARDV